MSAALSIRTVARLAPAAVGICVQARIRSAAPSAGAGRAVTGVGMGCAAA